jgi:hypothetical protein
MDNAGIVLENNVFHAVTADNSHSAKAFVLDGASPSIYSDIRDNVFESNHVSLQIVDNDGGQGNFDTRFTSNTIRRSKLGVERADYKGIAVGFWVIEAGNIQLIDTRFDNGVSPEIFWDGEGRKQIATGSLLDVQVVDEQGAALADAAVRLVDHSGRDVFYGATDANGQVGDIPVMTTVFTQKGADPRVITREDLGSYWIDVSVPGSSRLQQEIRLDSSQQITLVMHDTPMDPDPMDMIQAVKANKYLTGQAALVGEGDWNGDGLFDQADIVAALQHLGGAG